jgi:hypothetical protein
MGNSNGRQSGTSSPRNSSSTTSSHPIRTFDGGGLSPNGIYPGQPDYNPTHVLKYIRDRRLAPFYKGLDDYDEEWTDYQISYFVKEGKLPPTQDPPSPANSSPQPPSSSSTPSLVLPLSEETGHSPRIRGMSFVEQSSETGSINLGPPKDYKGRPRAQTIGSSTIVPTRGKPLEAVVYRNAIECPVCFLVFFSPLSSNIVLSSQYKSHKMLLETDLYGMFCGNETCRTTLPNQRR